MKTKLRQHFSIESARYLPHLPKTHPCSHMHGHSFKIILDLIGDLDPQLGWVMDYNDIKKVTQPILASLDHQVLNEVPGLENPTSEILARWLFEKLHPLLPGLTQVTVAETPFTECCYPA